MANTRRSDARKGQPKAAGIGNRLASIESAQFVPRYPRRPRHEIGANARRPVSGPRRQPALARSALRVCATELLVKPRRPLTDAAPSNRRKSRKGVKPHRAAPDGKSVPPAVPRPRRPCAMVGFISAHLQAATIIRQAELRAAATSVRPHDSRRGQRTELSHRSGIDRMAMMHHPPVDGRYPRLVPDQPINPLPATWRGGRSRVQVSGRWCRGPGCATG